MSVCVEYSKHDIVLNLTSNTALIKLKHGNTFLVSSNFLLIFPQTLLNSSIVGVLIGLVCTLYCWCWIRGQSYIYDKYYIQTGVQFKIEIFFISKLYSNFQGSPILITKVLTRSM